MSTAQVDLTVRGGFPITVEIERLRGPSGDYEYDITDIRTPAGKNAEFILKRMSQREKDDMLDYAIERAF